jgi:peptidoglycan/LPS O-acetylase OafA/YrhL
MAPILLLLLAAIVAGVVWLNVSSRRIEKDGEWHVVGPGKRGAGSMGVGSTEKRPASKIPKWRIEKSGSHPADRRPARGLCFPSEIQVLSETHAHYPALDGVRGMAILLVLLVYANLVPGGRIGVDLFFVLSGFLITSILLTEQKKYGSISFARFYIRRGLRLFPALFLMVACVVPYIALLHPDQMAKTALCVAAILVYLFNWLLVWQWPDLSLHQWMFSHVWSLSVEEQFYWFWPLILAAFYTSRLGGRTVILIFLGVIAYSTLARFFLWHGESALNLYFRTDTRIDGLVLGALVAWLTVNDAINRDRYKRIIGWSGVAGLLCLLWMSQYEMLNND